MYPKRDVAEACGIHDGEAGSEVTVVDGGLDEANGRIVAGNVACGKLSMFAFTEDVSGCVP